MAEFLKKRWVLLVLLVVFVIFKLPHLNVPYYWDESWVYVPAIKEMYRNGLSLLPNAINTDLSARAIRCFFHVLGAAWMHVFGDSYVSLHSFGLAISVLFLIAVYEIGLRMFNQRVAIMALLLVAAQVMFFVQSSFVLFEILIPLLIILSLYFYVERRYILSACCLTALFLTKESGLVAGFVIGLDAITGLFRKGLTTKEKLSRFIPVAVACVITGLFFICQKVMNGWYLYPFHLDSLLTTWNAFIYRFRTCTVAIMFYDSLRFYIYLALILLLAIVAVRAKKWKCLFVIAPGYLVYMFVSDPRSVSLGLDNFKWLFALFLLCYFVMVYILGSLFDKGSPKYRFVMIIGVFTMLYTIFSAVNTLTFRYMLTALLPSLLVVAALYDELITRSYKWIYYPVVAGILVMGYFGYKDDVGIGDINLGAFRAIDVQQRVVEYMKKGNYYHDHIASNSFMAQIHLNNPNTGFTDQQHIFHHVDAIIDSTTKLVIFDNIESDPRYEAVKKDTTFRLLERIANGEVWSEVYIRK